MDQASINSNNMDGECQDSTAGQGSAGLDLQDNVVQSRAGIASAWKNLHCSFKEEKDSLE